MKLHAWMTPLLFYDLNIVYLKRWERGRRTHTHTQESHKSNENPCTIILNHYYSSRYTVAEMVLYLITWKLKMLKERCSIAAAIIPWDLVNGPIHLPKWFIFISSVFFLLFIYQNVNKVNYWDKPREREKEISDLSLRLNSKLHLKPLNAG